MPTATVDPRLAAVAARHKQLMYDLDRLDAAVWAMDPSDDRDRLEAAADMLREMGDELETRLTEICAGQAFSVETLVGEEQP